jgi:WD40 repeat protein
MGRFFGVLIVAGAIAGVGAWYLNLLPFPFTDSPTGPGSHGSSHSKLELGQPLYPPQPLPPIPPRAERPGRDPVVIAGNLTVIDKMDACASVSGKLLFVGQEVPEGSAQVAGIAPFLQSKIYHATVHQGDQDYSKLFYRLSEGEVVGQDEMVALVDPAKAVLGVVEKKVKLEKSEAEYEAALKIDKEAERRLEVELRLGKLNSELDRMNAILTRIKTEAEMIGKRGERDVAKIDLKQEKDTLRRHYVHNGLAVRHCIVKTIYKLTGEAVKEFDPVLHLFALDKMTAEGLVEMQFAPRLKLGQTVSVEPSRETSPRRVWRSHKKEINAVAVTHNGLAASASEDGTVALWDIRYDGTTLELRHGQPVRSIACSPPAAKVHWLVAGLADGKIYCWDLEKLLSAEASDPKFELKPVRYLPDAHVDSVTALAFSPDGEYFASGATDGTIKLWNPSFLLQKEQKRPEDSMPPIYPFDAAHGVEQPHSGPVTSLTFTPQCRLVSAARDNTLRVWELHEKGAHLVGDPISGRGGSVNQLGVSRDGRYMLFDQGKTLQLLGLDGRTLTTIQNPAGVIPFETLAQFSPDASMMLTAGAPEGRLQLWKSPIDGQRGFEFSQLVTSERSPVTAAAFFDPTADGEVKFAVSGTKDGTVYLWEMPSRAQVQSHRIQNVKLTQISQNVETRQIRVGVEVANPDLTNPDARLIPGQPVTIVIE